MKKNRRVLSILNTSVKDCLFCGIHPAVSIINKNSAPNPPSLPSSIQGNRALQSTGSGTVFRESLLAVAKENLERKYLTSRDYYNVKIINDVIYNENTHIVSVFKDYLIYDDVSEFLKRFYAEHESVNRLPKIYDFYDKYSKVPPPAFTRRSSPTTWCCKKASTCSRTSSASSASSTTCSASSWSSSSAPRRAERCRTRSRTKTGSFLRGSSTPSRRSNSRSSSAARRNSTPSTSPLYSLDIFRKTPSLQSNSRRSASPTPASPSPRMPSTGRPRSPSLLRPRHERTRQ